MRHRLFIVLTMLVFIITPFIPVICHAEARFPPPDFPLLEAVRKGDVKKVKSLLRNLRQTPNRDDLDKEGYSGDTPLSVAALKGNLQIVKLLIENGAAVDGKRETNEKTPLMNASKQGHVEVVKYLIAKGADVNKTDNDGYSALMRAVESFNKTNISSIKVLIERGADLNSVNNKGETALILAAKRGNAETVKILLAGSASPSIKDKSGKSAWTYAYEKDNSGIVMILEKSGYLRDYEGMTWEGNMSKQKAAFIKVVNTPEEWSQLWGRAFDKQAPAMDFERFVVACVFLGYNADWLYSIDFGKVFIGENKLVIPYGLHEIMLRLSGPFKASGQYHMKVFEKSKGVEMILKEDVPSPRRRYP